jgi:hypothetical protein
MNEIMVTAETVIAVTAGPRSGNFFDSPKGERNQ